MRRPNRIVRAAVLSLLLVAAGAWTAPTECEDFMVILGITEGPDPLGITEGSDPIGTVDWVPVGSTGHAVPMRADGRPHIARDPRTGRKTVVWASGLAGRYDVAISSFDGRAWSPIELITTTGLGLGIDEHDPQVFIGEAGEQYVAWWTRKGLTAEVQLVHRAEGSSHWSHAQRRVRDGSHPGIAVLDGRLYLTYERPAVGGGRELLLQVEDADGSLDDRHVAIAGSGMPLRSSVHVEEGRIWIVWQHSDTLLAYVELIDGRWATPVEYFTWTKRTWAGLEEGRHRIRDAVFDH